MAVPTTPHEWRPLCRRPRHPTRTPRVLTTPHRKLRRRLPSPLRECCPLRRVSFVFRFRSFPRRVSPLTGRGQPCITTSCARLNAGQCPQGVRHLPRARDRRRRPSGPGFYVLWTKAEGNRLSRPPPGLVLPGSVAYLCDPGHGGPALVTQQRGHHRRRLKYRPMFGCCRASIPGVDAATDVKTLLSVELGTRHRARV